MGTYKPPFPFGNILCCFFIGHEQQDPKLWVVYFFWPGGMDIFSGGHKKWDERYTKEKVFA